MKMKKIICSLMISVLCFMTAISGVSAASCDTSKIDQAYAKVIEYYKNNNSLVDADKIIAVESLGLEAENGYELPKDMGKIKSSSSVGDVTKTLISEILLGNDPRNIDGTNLVELVENMVKEDGTVVYNEQNITSAGDLVYVVFALYSAESNKLSQAVDALVNTQNENGSFGYGFNSESLDITGWVVEALSLSGKTKYSENIEKAKSYLNSKLDEADGAYSYYNEQYGFEEGKNSDTQSIVLSGLLTYDKDGVLSGNYNVGENDIINYLLSFQKDDGSFYWVIGNDGYTPGLSTSDSARCLGTLKNGSVFEKARKAYDAIINPVKEEPKQESKAEPTTTTTTTAPTAPAQSDKKVQSVKTGDETNVVVYVSLSMMSAGLFLVLKKEYERVH